MFFGNRNFKHDRLADAGHNIRLLKIISVSATSNLIKSGWLKSKARLARRWWLGNVQPEETTILCELTTWPLDKIPAYVAASYTWGSASHQRSIVLNGRRFKIRRNCYNLLEHAFEHGLHTTYLWIDAICINQKDEAEKSAQVAMMGKIYKDAEQVYVFLGRHENNSQLLLDLVQRYADHAEKLWQQMHRDGPLPPGIQTIKGLLDRPPSSSAVTPRLHDLSPRTRAQLFFELSVPKLFETLPNSQLASALQALYDWSDRAYFNRLWIVQEVLLGRDVRLVCGDRLLQFVDLVSFVSEFEVHCTNVGVRLQLGGTNKNLNSLLNTVNFWDTSGKPLLEMVEAFSSFSCFDPRDRIFGMLALVDWEGYDKLAPNYALDVLALALQTICYLCPRITDLEEEGSAIPDDGWPIVSATHTATALGLHSKHKMIKILLKQRRSKSKPGARCTYFTRPADTHAHIPILVDGYCRIADNCASPVRSMYTISSLEWRVRPGADLPSFFRPIPMEHTQDLQDSDVRTTLKVRVQLPPAAQNGDFILSLHTSGSDWGLLARAYSSMEDECRIIGQVIFETALAYDDHALDSHVADNEPPDVILGDIITAFFDPLDLLLFVCQSLDVNRRKALDWNQYAQASDKDKINESHFSQPGEIVENIELQVLRLETSVTKPENDRSSFVKMTRSSIRTIGDENDGGEAGQVYEQLRDFQHRWRIKSSQAA